MNYRDREDAALEVASGTASAGGYAIAIQGDVAQESDVERVFLSSISELARSLGFNQPRQPSIEMSNLPPSLKQFPASHSFDALSGHELLNNEFVEVVDTHEDWLATVTGLHSLIKKYNRQFHGLLS